MTTTRQRGTPPSTKREQTGNGATTGYVLTPGRYVGAEVQEDDGEPFAEKMQRLTAQWQEQQAEAVRLDAAIDANLKALGFGDKQ